MDFTLLFIYFITVNKYRFFISVIGYINVQIIGIGYKKINIGRSLLSSRCNVINVSQAIPCTVFGCKNEHESSFSPNI